MSLRRTVLAAQRLAGLGASEPVRLELPAVKEWLSSGSWSAEALAADMASAASARGEEPGSPLVVKRSAQRLFMLVEGREDEGDARVSGSHRFALDRLGVGAFWHALRRAPAGGGDGLYLTGDPAALCPRAAASLACAASPGGASAALSLAAGRAAHAPSLWLSSEGCVTVCHYDTSANVLVQLLGEKTVQLWPPGSAPELRVYPDSHPRARKSQADVHAAGGGLPAPAHSVLLRAGDALYIPSFYFHRVVASTAPCGSASLNCFSRCELSAAAQQLVERFSPSALPPLPVHPRWPREGVQLPALAHLLRRVHAALGAQLLACARGAELPALSCVLSQALASRYGHASSGPAGAGGEGGGGVSDDAQALRRAKRRRGEAAQQPPPIPPLPQLRAELDAFLGLGRGAAATVSASSLEDECARLAQCALPIHGEPAHTAAARAQEAAYARGVAELLLCHIAESAVVAVLGRGAGGARHGEGLRDVLRAVRAEEGGGPVAADTAL